MWDETMEYIAYINNIMKIKKSYPYDNCYLMIRFFENEKRFNLLKWVSNNNTLSNNMKKDYFPNSIDLLCKRDMNYDRSKDNSITNLLQWATEIISLYKVQANLYVNLKAKYEKALFAEKYEEASKLLGIIENQVCFSVWGIYQKFLILNLLGKQNESKNMLQKIQLNANNNNFAAFLLMYYEKLADKSIGFDEYVNIIKRLLESVDKNNIVWKYLDHKLDITTSKTVQGIKSTLLFDEQTSFIDYYESYIDSLQALSSRTSTFLPVKECIQKIHQDSEDFRVRNLFFAFIKINNSLCVDNEMSSLIEKYTCGKYLDLKKDVSKNQEKYRHDFTICNLFLKAGIDISIENVSFSKLWSEIYHIYTFNYEIENSIQKIGGYYKLFYGTSWKYKILGILVRKLNFNYEEDILKLSVLNDNTLTPLFYQVITDLNEKEKFLNLFKETAPITTQLHMYMLTGHRDDSLLKQVDLIRWKYYEIMKLTKQEEYRKSIGKCQEFLKKFENNKSSLYYQERIQRILYNCYIEEKEYVIAMNVYVDSYMISKELVIHMQLDKLIKKIEVLAEDSEEVHANICRPIVLRLFYKSLNDEVIVAYLDYLESQGCRTIKKLVDKYEKLDPYDIIFLNKVCTQTLLMKDYVSKTEVGGSAAELRAIVLRTLLQFDSTGQKEYLSELNTIYKSSQLQKKIDSFNHNRIFIDKENLFKYLKDELIQEFSKYKSVQEIKKIFCDSKKELQSHYFLLEQYWDNQKFYYGIIEKIKKAYLNESPYSLEDFLSTRIRHNYCNDNLKKVFENEKLFSKKIKDSSADYIINDYWKNKLSVEEYNIVIAVLSKFSQTIDNKIQEIKEKWIRIKKDRNSEGLFDYCDFTSFFMNFYMLDFESILDNAEEFFNAEIKVLDLYTKEMLRKIRHKIDYDLKPCYNEAISELEIGIKKLNFDSIMKSELLRKIEITKAKYVEDIEGFKDIFNMDNEKYPDFTMDELIEFCCKIEDDMNNQFRDAKVSNNIMCKKKYHGQIFPYLVDIVAILIRNAVQHSQISKMDDLKIEINVIPFKESEFVNMDLEYSNYSLVINIINNLSTEVDEVDLYNRVREKTENIYNGSFRKESNKEGGSGLYKIARTIYYSLNSEAAFYQKENKGYFDISIAIDLNQFEMSEVD